MPTRFMLESHTSKSFILDFRSNFNFAAKKKKKKRKKGEIWVVDARYL